MNITDIILLILIAIATGLALRSTIRRRRKGCCCGSCNTCGRNCSMKQAVSEHSAKK